jgi:SPP1 family predicted phage head-tail adaptor
MPVAIGKMTKWITLQQKSSTADATGQPQESWSDLCQVWAAIEPLSTKEAFAARQAEVIATHKVTIWYREDVHESAPLLRVLYTRDEKQRIIHVISGTEANDSKARQLELLCGEMQPWANQA